MSLDQRVALVTGASRGIGRAVSLALAAAGARVVINYAQSEAAAQEVVAAVNAAGGEAVAIRADVGSAAQVEAMIRQILDRWQRIDILVNNAGIVRDGLLLRMREQDWDDVLATNLKGTFLCTRAVLKPMFKQRWGRIINITSVVGITGNAGQANYAAAKAGMIGFTKAVAKEVASRGILVNAVAPGYIATDLTVDINEDARQQLIKRIPLGSIGDTEDVAGTVVFLASSAARYITGQVLNVDGGMVM